MRVGGKVIQSRADRKADCSLLSILRKLFMCMNNAISVETQLWSAGSSLDVFFFFFLPPRQPPPFPSHFPPLYTDLLKQRMCMDVFIINKPCCFYLQHVKADIFKVQHRSGSNAGVTNHCNDSCFLLVPMNQQLLLLLNTPVVFRTTTAVTSPDVT